MNPSHVMATGGVTAMLASAYEYLSNWPWHAFTQDQAMNFAGLTVFAVGALMACRSRPTAPPAAPADQTKP
jgi:hypothetical protein